MKLLLDTNICIYIINKKPLSVLEKFYKYSPGDIAISTITTSELFFGVEKSSKVHHNKVALEQFLLPFSILSYDNNASVYYGKIRAKLEKSGQLVGSLDMMIAAHALSLNIPIVTNNTKEFERIPRLKLLNWI